MKFVGPTTKAVPVWLAVTYLSSNVVLNSLNFYWFGKMIETVRKRFNGNKGDRSANGNLPDGAAGEKKGPKNNVRETGRRRGSSIVLEVADGLERDERLGVMMDGVVETPGQIDSEQKRGLEGKFEDMGKGKSSAVESSGNDVAAGRRR